MDTTTDPLARVRALMARATGDEKHEESTTSTLDALWVLYDRVLRVDPADPERRGPRPVHPEQGPRAAALYAILAAKGFFPDLARRLHGARRTPRLASRPARWCRASRPRRARSATGCDGGGRRAGAASEGPPRAARGRALRRRRAQRGLQLGSRRCSRRTSAWQPHAGSSSTTTARRSPMGPWTRACCVRLGRARVDGHDHDALGRRSRVRHAERPVAVVADVPEGEW